MSNYSRLPELSEGDYVSGIGRKYQTHRLAIHEAGPNSLPHASIIPQASVISDSPSPVQVTRELSLGDLVWVPGLGTHKIVRDRNSPDWPRLVPQFGPRYYVHFQGFGQWHVLDREEDGAFAAIPQAVRDTLGMHKYAIANVMEAECAAAIMSLGDMRSKGEDKLPYK